MPWSEPAFLAGVAIASALVSALGTAWAIAHARRRGMLDHPGARRSHAAPTPRGGGVGLVVAMLALFALLGWRLQDAFWACAAVGVALVAAIGWWDDHRPLPVWPRLLVHALAAAALACGLAWSGGTPAQAALAFAIAMVAINAWNFMDGIDALAASQALLCAVAYAAVGAGAWTTVAVGMAGACLGFLAFNLPPARIFLGDVGSGALGYLVAVLLAGCSMQSPASSWPLLLLPPMAMLADAGLTLLWRLRRGDAWWRPHVEHAYQRQARAHGHARVAAGYALWTFAAAGIMLWLLHMPVPVGIWGSAAAMVLGGIVWTRLHGRYTTGSEGFGS